LNLFPEAAFPTSYLSEISLQSFDKLQEAVESGLGSLSLDWLVGEGNDLLPVPPSPHTMILAKSVLGLASCSWGDGDCQTCCCCCVIARGTSSLPTTWPRGTILPFRSDFFAGSS